MPLMDFVVTALAVALLLHITGMNSHPRLQAGLAAVYASAALLVAPVVWGWNFAIYTLATGFVATLLARLASWAVGMNEPRSASVSQLRSRVPRL
jgi:hypothetical protein